MHENSCSPKVLVVHSAGCPDYFVSNFTWFNYWKPEVMGSVLVALGLATGLLGKRSFAFIAPLDIAIFVKVTLLYALTIVFTFHGSLTGFFVTLGVVALVVVGMALWLRRPRFYGLTITLLGGLTGFFIGNLLYALLYSVSGLESFATAIIFPILCSGTLMGITFAKREMYG